MIDLRAKTTKQIKAIRNDMTSYEFYPPPRDPRIDRRFWTLAQASLYKSALRGGHKRMSQAALDFTRIRTVVGRDFMPY